MTKTNRKAGQKGRPCHLLLSWKPCKETPVTERTGPTVGPVTVPPALSSGQLLFPGGPPAAKSTTSVGLPLRPQDAQR